MRFCGSFEGQDCADLWLEPTGQDITDQFVERVGDETVVCEVCADVEAGD